MTKDIFLSKDAWAGDEARSQSMNGWSYVEGNPINRVDSSGFISGCASPNCKLQIFTTLVFPIKGYIQPGHLGFIFTDEAGRWFTLSSGPEIPEYFNWGILKGGKPIPYDPKLSEQAEDEAIVTIAEGMDVCTKISCLIRAMDDITSIGMSYDPLSRNSNAAAYTALKTCNLPTIGLLQRLTSQLPPNWYRIHPGWGIDLFTPPSPSWIDPPVCHDYPELCYPTPPNPPTNT